MLRLLLVTKHSIGMEQNVRLNRLFLSQRRQTIFILWVEAISSEGKALATFHFFINKKQQTSFIKNLSAV
ncbi:hypothetical protein [Sporosarcina sp. P18a]|uniref:hypothetical protein n=1 Tax=Sporosarcina sp. P18a TaxID=2048259 RepID=UPI001181B364|nr:hypothetical protein [Sporosarcina sp. P18a]